MTLCFATHNRNKLEEIRKEVPKGVRLIGLDELGITEDIPETGDTIEGNSLMKTVYVFEKHGVACFGDDTGLEVEALHNEPGVYSARYAGIQRSSEDNMNLLLQKLEGVSNRRARFKTVITYIDEAGVTKQFTGLVAGEITLRRAGVKGFGYDPIFRPEGAEKTFAEMEPSEKNAISHRARAFRQLIDYLNS